MTRPENSELTPSTPFTVIVAGNQRYLFPKHYRFIATRLNDLLAKRLPHVKVLSDRMTAGIFGERWAEEHGLPFERFRFDDLHPIRDGEAQCLEWMLQQRPSGLIVLEVENRDAAELRRRARAAGVAVRVVDMRLVVGGPAPK
jgi:hypothetical protein